MKNKALLLQVANLMDDQRADIDVKISMDKELKLYLLSSNTHVRVIDKENKETALATSHRTAEHKIIPSEIMQFLNRNICDEYHGLKYFEKLLMVKAWNLSDTIAH